MTVTPIVASYLRKNNAVVVVHGIDYNKNGVYDGVLERSDIDRSLTGESTAPALCGPLVADKAARRQADRVGGTAAERRCSPPRCRARRPRPPRPRVCALHPRFGQT